MYGFRGSAMTEHARDLPPFSLELRGGFLAHLDINMLGSSRLRSTCLNPSFLSRMIFKPLLDISRCASYLDGASYVPQEPEEVMAGTSSKRVRCGAVDSWSPLVQTSLSLLRGAFQRCCTPRETRNN